MAATTTPDYPGGLTFEKVWASIMELRDSQKETDRQIKETERILKENTERQMKENAERQKEIDRHISKLGSRFGELVEHLVAPNIMKKFNDLHFNFTKCALDVIITKPGEINAAAEVDIMLENGDIVMAVEVKAKPNDEDVKEHIQRMEKLRQAADLRQDKRRHQGAIAGAIISNEIRSYILKQGFYLIEQTGDTVQINIPPGFTPREW